MEDKNRRRRKLTPAEERALERQRKKEKNIQQKKIKEDAKYREEIRKEERKKAQKNLAAEDLSKVDRSKKKKKTEQQEPSSQKRKPPVNESKKNINKKKKRTTPDIIKAETDKRVRDMNPKDYDDGYYIDEVEVRRAQAKEQRRKRKAKMPRTLTPKQRKLRQRVTYISICLIVVLIGIILSLTVLFKTESIEVRGNSIYENSEIIELSEISEGNNIFLATLFANTDAIKEKLPYIKNAKLSFEIPNKVIINVQHDTAYAALKVKGVNYLINKDGKILEKTEKIPKKIIKISSGEIKSTKIGDFVEYKNQKATNTVFSITRCLSDNNYTGVTEIDVEKMSDIKIIYDDRILIKMGLPEDLDYKMTAAFKIIHQKVDPNKSKTVKGVLNVSECNDTKRAYFNEGDMSETRATVPIVTQETTETESVRSTYVTISEDESVGENSNYDTETATESVE